MAVFHSSRKDRSPVYLVNISFPEAMVNIKKPIKQSEGALLKIKSYQTFIFLILLFVLNACTPNESPIKVSLSENLIQGEVNWPSTPENQKAYVIGFDRRLEPKEDVRIYALLLTYLERETGYHFILHITPKDGSLVTEIGEKQVDFAVVGTLTYLQAHEQYAARMLVRGVNAEGESVYRAAIVTRPGSGINSLIDLKGRSFVFGASSSTQGHLIPRMMLAQAGVELTDLRAYDYTGSHAETANYVISGRADAGGMQDTLAQSLAARGLLRILVWSDPFPSSGILVGKHISAEVAEKVLDALLRFDPSGKDQGQLYHWERTEMPRGFTTTNDQDYDYLRNWAEKFALLTP